MSRPLPLARALLLAVLASAPASVVVTVFSSPFWSWFEATTGIECVGHSGPAQWCYGVVFLALFTSAVVGLLVWWRRQQRRAETG